MVHPIWRATVAVADDIGRLSDRQKEILRLVHRRYETKDVSRALDLPPGRVNKDIAQAKAILGVGRRAAAARILVEFEAQQASADGGHSVAGYPISLPEPAISRSDQPVVEPLGTQREDAEALGEAQMPYSAAGTLSLSIPLPFPTNGRPRNDLKGMSLATSVAIIAVASLFAAGAAVSLLFAFNHWVHG